jgi:hypothetical protein
MPRQSWTDQESLRLRKLAGQVPAGELARQLKRTEASVRFHASKIGVSLKHPPLENRPAKQKVRLISDSVEKAIAPAAIERALTIYRQLQERDESVCQQARKILTQHIFGMVDQGECDEQRLTVGGLAHLKAIERDHAIKSAQAPTNKRKASV